MTTVGKHFCTVVEGCRTRIQDNLKFLSRAQSTYPGNGVEVRNILLHKTPGNHWVFSLVPLQMHIVGYGGLSFCVPVLQCCPVLSEPFLKIPRQPDIILQPPIFLKILVLMHKLSGYFLAELYKIPEL